MNRQPAAFSAAGCDYREETMNRVDIAIIGTGPAGISAAINARIRHKSFLLFGPKTLSDKIQRAERIDNYPGLSRVTGAQLNAVLLSHLQEMDISITEKRITGVYPMGDYFFILADQEEYEASTVILATGVEATKPIPGERELLGRGVSYCATCDGNLYRGKTIAVVCDCEELEEEALYIANLAEKVYYDPRYRNPTLTAPNLEYLPTPIREVTGQRRVGMVRCGDGRELPLSGVFFLKQSVSPSVLMPQLHSENGRVLVDRAMATNVSGCFACGDCTGSPFQITKALGEGNIAAHSAFAYLAKIGKKEKEA